MPILHNNDVTVT